MKLTLPFVRATLLLVALLTAAIPTAAQESYFKGRTIRMVVGFSAGAGYAVPPS